MCADMASQISILHVSSALNEKIQPTALQTDSANSQIKMQQIIKYSTLSKLKRLRSCQLLNMMNLRNYPNLKKIRFAEWKAFAEFAELDFAESAECGRLSPNARCPSYCIAFACLFPLSTLKTQSCGSRKFSRMSTTLIGRGSRPAQMTLHARVKI